MPSTTVSAPAHTREIIVSGKPVKITLTASLVPWHEAKRIISQHEARFPTIQEIVSLFINDPELQKHYNRKKIWIADPNLNPGGFMIDKENNLVDPKGHIEWNNPPHNRKININEKYPESQSYRVPAVLIRNSNPDRQATLDDVPFEVGYIRDTLSALVFYIKPESE
ncbi:MAG: hypothetical protein ABR981_05985 [Candidatus Micrarchaeaceae archaeon]|jgi:hypothetical protein